jgi:lipid II:glycine glycyltransferase (peptidoglycan interpeptide bridge formation enzyme)
VALFEPKYPEETENTLPVLDKLLKALVITLKNKSIFIQFRNFFAWRDAEKQIFQNNGFIFHNRLNLLVNTDSEKNVWAGLSKSRRRQVRKGLTSGAVIKTPANESEVKSFYHLLVDLYKNKIHKPLPDWSFFQAFYKESQREKLGVIKLAEYKKRIIGGILLPVTPEKNLYEWYVVGMDKEFKKQYPSVLVTWAAIRFALENGLRHFDFMGMGIPGKEYGVRAFKKKFGGQMVDYGRFAMRTNKILYSIAETGYNIIRFCKEI